MVWKVIDDNRTRLTVLTVIKGESVAICSIFFDMNKLFNLCFCAGTQFWYHVSHRTCPQNVLHQLQLWNMQRRNGSGGTMQSRGGGRKDQDAHGEACHQRRVHFPEGKVRNVQNPYDVWHSIYSDWFIGIRIIAYYDPMIPIYLGSILPLQYLTRVLITTLVKRRVKDGVVGNSME